MWCTVLKRNINGEPISASEFACLASGANTGNAHAIPDPTIFKACKASQV